MPHFEKPQEGSWTILESRRVTRFPINDQEIMIRHLHHAAGEQVAEYQKSMAEQAVPTR